MENDRQGQDSGLYWTKKQDILLPSAQYGKNTCKKK